MSTNPTTIHLVRHGHTVLNAEKRFRGRRDVPLNQRGRREAIAAARHLATADLSAVYSSPLGRALEVGTAVAAAAGLDEVREQPDLVNLEYGAWEALTNEESQAVDPVAWQAYLDSPETSVCPDGEALVDAGARVVAALRAIGAAHPGENVAAVSHGVMLRLAVLHTAGLITDNWQFPIGTGRGLIFEVVGDDVRLLTAAADIPA